MCHDSLERFIFAINFNKFCTQVSLRFEGGGRRSRRLNEGNYFVTQQLDL